jgi:hypothetical protein
MGGYLGLMSLMWLGLWWGVPRWAARWRLDRPAAAPAAPTTALPRVSVCVPARDEALNIGDCVRSALASRWAELEAGGGSTTAPPMARAPQRWPPPREIPGSAWSKAQSGPPAGRARPGPARGQRARPRGSGCCSLTPTCASIRTRIPRAGPTGGAGTASNLLSVFGRWRLDSFWERALIHHGRLVHPRRGRPRPGQRAPRARRVCQRADDPRAARGLRGGGWARGDPGRGSSTTCGSPS